jgi:hypothetical protein
MPIAFVTSPPFEFKTTIRFFRNFNFLTARQCSPFLNGPPAQSIAPRKHRTLSVAKYSIFFTAALHNCSYAAVFEQKSVEHWGTGAASKEALSVVRTFGTDGCVN